MLHTPDSPNGSSGGVRATVRTALGVDPGSRSSGFVVRRSGELLASSVVERPKGQSLQTFGIRVSAEAQDLLSEWHPDVAALEGLNVPNSHMGRGTAQVRSYGETNRIIGHLEALGWAWVVIAPKGNGSAAPSSYPDALYGEREHPANGGKGTGKLRHARSAWDVAGKAVAHT